jgi:hypothetical protein
LNNKNIIIKIKIQNEYRLNANAPETKPFQYLVKPTLTKLIIAKYNQSIILYVSTNASL